MGVVHAIAISRTTRRIVKLNITLALGVKLAVILTGALGLTGLWAAVLADTGVALWCVANTYFIQKRS
ncbi:p-ATPase superfamily P-type ATPase cadmium transporter [Prevotella sp. CAG:891]|nr:p-ATPase superfamily P-type ATPase cadmium transporter [Prevotella sp. CAG:891]